jgi:predicted NBD/HSP70 family sugar kinase
MPTPRIARGALPSRQSERLVLQRLRRLGEASRADLARATALTNTAVGQIIRDLERGGLVRALGRKHQGQRGQPGTLLGLEPCGAFAIGVRLDRTRIETVLIDLLGRVLAHRAHDRLLPAPTQALEVVRADVEALAAELLPARRRRIAGVGVARPYNLGSWLEQLDLPREAFASWGDEVAFGAELERASGLPVVEENDGTAAAIAELFHGHGRHYDDFLYVFIGPAIGGGVVLSGQCLRGATGNAGDIGMIPVPSSRLSSAPAAGRRAFLLGRASVNTLYRHLRARGEPPGNATLPYCTAAVEEWLEDCADALAAPLLAARAFLDVPTVIIDSDLPGAALDRLIARLKPLLAAAVAEARTPPALLRGSFGAMAGALGAATLPLFENFGPRSMPHELAREGAPHVVLA